MLLPKAAVAATAAANRVLDAVFGRSDAFLLAMEKPHDVELSYNFIKYADGVTRFTELRYVLTPLVVVLTDFLLVDVIQEVRRLRVLLGLRKRAATMPTTTTTTVPMITLTGPAPQPLQPPRRESPPVEQVGPSDADQTAADGDGEEITVVVAEPQGRTSTKAKATLRNLLNSPLHHRTDSDVVIEADIDAAAIPPSSAPSTAATTAAPHGGVSNTTSNQPLQASLPASHHSGRSCRTASDAASATSHSSTPSSRSSRTAHPYAVIRRARRAPPTRRHQRSGDDSSQRADATAAPPSVPHSPVSTPQPQPQPSTHRPRKATARRSRTRRSASQPQSQGLIPTAPTNTAGFVSQGVFLLQLVQEVRVRLQRQGTGVMAGSLAAVATAEEKRGRSGGLMNPLRTVGGLGGRRRQLAPTTVRHHRGALQRGGAGDGLAGAVGTATDGEGGAGAGAAGGAEAGALTTATTATTTAAAAAATSNINTASFMFIERLEVQRVTLYVTFIRHRPDPLRPILGAYAWMLPSQLTQREFYLPAWTLTQQVETAASLRARLIKWGMHSLREQWTKVTKLGTLLDALQFWQHRTLPLHGAPQTLTLARVQRQRQEREGQPLLFALCVSSGEDGEDPEGEMGEEASLSGGQNEARMAPLPLQHHRRYH